MTSYPFEPWVRLRDYQPFSNPSWEEIDQKASDLLKKDCLGIPSIRVGLHWILEYLNCRRHLHHILVPKFLCRCILNTLNRSAFPVEIPTSQTRLALVIHQFGFQQRLDVIKSRCETLKIPYVEDSPHGLAFTETLGPGSLAKFISLSKILPALKGGLAFSEDKNLMEFFKKKRRETSSWSWVVFGSLAPFRWKEKLSGEATLAGAAYELYPESKGDNCWLRGNLLRCLKRLESFAAEAQNRLVFLKERLNGQVLIPDATRIPYVIPYIPSGNPHPYQQVFRSNGYDPTLYRVDVARNLFAPQYEKALLISINTRIPLQRFQTLIDSLRSLHETDSRAKSMPVASSVL